MLNAMVLDCQSRRLKYPGEKPLLADLALEPFSETGDLVWRQGEDTCWPPRLGQTLSSILKKTKQSPSRPVSARRISAAPPPQTCLCAPRSVSSMTQVPSPESLPARSRRVAIATMQTVRRRAGLAPAFPVGGVYAEARSWTLRGTANENAGPFPRAV